MKITTFDTTDQRYFGFLPTAVKNLQKIKQK